MVNVQQMTEPVAVWMDADRPARLVWAGTRYTVTDTPTPLHVEDPHVDELLDVVTYPPLRLVGWRFQATSAAGETFVFDVRSDDRERWDLVGIYS